MSRIINKKLLLIVFSVFIFGCDDDDIDNDIIDQPEITQLNAFSMRLASQIWEPATIDYQECMRTFYCSWSSLTKQNVEQPFYNIKAYKDPHAKTGPNSENFFELQIFDVQETGSYEISATYKEDFSSFALFVMNLPDGDSRRYVNEVNGNSFVVEIDEFIPIEGFSLPGIKGSFYGTLYNEDNPLDSLVLEEGDFTFGKINWNNFNQCPE